MADVVVDRGRDADHAGAQAGEQVAAGAAAVPAEDDQRVDAQLPQAPGGSITSLGIMSSARHAEPRIVPPKAVRPSVEPTAK